MTTQELIDELTLQLGNRTDITDARYTLWLNWGLLDLIGAHRKRLFSPKRFRALEEENYWTTSVVTGTCGSTVSSTTFQVSGGDQQAEDDYYNGWVVELTAYSGTEPSGLLNQKKLVVDYAGTGSYVCTIDSAWSVNPDTNTTYSLYKRRYALSDIAPSGHDIMSIERMEWADGSGEIDHKDWDDFMGGLPSESGEPTQFALHGGDVLFNKACNVSQYIRMFYRRLPTLLSVSTPTVEPEIPEDWHEIILLGAKFRGFSSLMEPDRADEARDKYVDEAENKLDDYSIASPNIQRALKVKRS